jgi:FlaA1/EpsC-like NDP-sugar epimerase
MLRRFSINFALFSMLLDGGMVVISLWLAAWLRPQLNQIPGIAPIPTPLVVPASLYLIFPLIWVLVYSTISIYDGRKYLRVVDEFAAMSLGTMIASVSAAGVLYLSYREISRAQFLVFIALAYPLHLLWRVLVRRYFRTQVIFSEQSRRILIVGAGPLGEKVRDQMLRAEVPNLKFSGFVDRTENATTRPISLAGAKP